MKLLAPCCDTRKSCIDVAAMWGGTEKMRSLRWVSRPFASERAIEVENNQLNPEMGPGGMSNLVGSIYAAT